MLLTDLHLLRSVYNHVVLPPDIPGRLDSNLLAINQDLLLRVQNACSEVASATGAEFGREINFLRKSLNYCWCIHISQYLDSSQLQSAFRDLNDGESLIIHVVEQNAGLLVRRNIGCDNLCQNVNG